MLVKLESAFNLLNRVVIAQECDATDHDSSNSARPIKKQFVCLAISVKLVFQPKIGWFCSQF